MHTCFAGLKAIVKTSLTSIKPRIGEQGMMQVSAFANLDEGAVQMQADETGA
ncbi:hypothetical protein BH11PSE11_BH11PSE11_05350 [soil metagenome]